MQSYAVTWNTILSTWQKPLGYTYALIDDNAYDDENNNLCARSCSDDAVMSASAIYQFSRRERDLKKYLYMYNSILDDIKGPVVVVEWEQSAKI